MSFFAIALLSVLVQEPPAPVTLGQAEDMGAFWLVKGTGTQPEETFLRVALRKVERRWDAPAGRFREVLSDAMRRTGTGIVRKQAFEVRLKPGPAGSYQLAVIDGEKEVFETERWMGQPKGLLAAYQDQSRKILELAERARPLLEELVRVGSSKERPTAKAANVFQDKLLACEMVMRKLKDASDLTASVAVIDEIYFHFRNSQVWQDVGKPDATSIEEAGNDRVDMGNGGFLNVSVTPEKIRATLDGLKGLVAREVQVSLAAMLRSLLAAAPENPKALEKAVGAARESGPWLKEISAEGEPFLEVLKEAEKATVEQTPALGEKLDGFLKQYVTRR